MRTIFNQSTNTHWRNNVCTATRKSCSLYVKVGLWLSKNVKPKIDTEINTGKIMYLRKFV